MNNVEEKHVKVTIVWGGTGESKPENVSMDENAGEVFETIYDRFNQSPTDQDTFEINDKPFEKSQFSTTVNVLIETLGKELVFEVIPPTSGA